MSQRQSDNFPVDFLSIEVQNWARPLNPPPHPHQRTYVLQNINSLTLIYDGKFTFI